ncbi:MAG: selenocysteine-specific translation elongation factor [Betaproteobacteria bacterium]|nr:selenocysteine-specific translation elongation factor [Betaproteobacteria bacterium]
MIVATAGHIDHGKTTLVRRLTGVDTDRLPEEKARGISIDLGFAYLPLTDGGVIGFVDVPGHERFIRNMLAGVCGIDFALLVVAADDGVMPQTVEHLNILDLLNVTRGVTVITKSDRVDESRVRQVADNVRGLLAASALAAIPVLAVSAVTGAGIEELQRLLSKESAELTRRRSAGQRFRLAIDRAFTVAGSGTVVTGTVFNGAVKTGDKLTLSPAGATVRVRGIQIQGTAAAEARAGQRCALNLSGADLESVRRGDWVLDEALHQPTQRIDARVTVLASEAQPVKHWMPVHMHLATADVTARIAIRRGDAVAPGASAIVQLVLDKPIGALHGDRFILRDQSASRTVGGGIVIDPFAPAGRRSSPARLAELAALEESTPEAALNALGRIAISGVDLARFERTFNLTPDRAAEIYAAADIVAVGKDSRIGVPRASYADLREKVIAALAAFHRQTPQALGKDSETLRAELAPRLPAPVFGSLLRELADERRLEVSGSVARLPGHDATSNPADEKLWQTIRPALEAGGFTPPPLPDLSARLRLKEAVVKDFLHRKAKSGEVMRVTADRFYPRPTLAALAAIAQATARAQANGMFTAAQYRDATGVGRSLAIEILEFLDTLGITQRIGDARKMRKDFVPLLGPADPPVKPAPPATAAPKAAGAARARPAQHYKR